MKAVPRSASATMSARVSDESSLGKASGQSAAQGIVEEVRAAFVLADDHRIQTLSARVREERFGLGLIDALIELDGVTEVMANPDGSVWVERWGKMHATPHVVGNAQKAIDRRGPGPRTP